MGKITEILKGLLSFIIVVCIALLVMWGIKTGYNIYKVYAAGEKEEQIAELEETIQEYKQQEKENEIRKKELEKQLLDPKIIQDKLIQKGKIISLESKARYKNYLKEDKWLGDRELYLDIEYRYGISMDLSNISYEVIRGENIIYGEKVVVTVPKDKLEIEYLERIIKDTDTISESSLLVKDYEPEDINKIYEIAKQQVKKHIEQDREVYYKAHENLKGELSKMIIGLGFKHVEFSE